MPKFDGILLISDWDGTLSFNNEINPINIEKIKYFQKNGGLFTICTGRYPEYLKENGYLDLITPNTYILCLNGAIIQDMSSGEVLYSGGMDNNSLLAFDEVIENNFNFNSLLYYTIGGGKATAYTKKEYLEAKSKLSPNNTHKLLITTSEESEAIAVRDFLRGRMGKDYEVMRSWATGIEIIYKENSKGVAIKRLKEITGAKTVVTVGDYENDLSMLVSADISYAVENATKEAKAAAKRRAPHVRDGALGFIIDELEKNLP